MEKEESVLRFFQQEWAWVLLAPVLMVLGTTLHEGAHAVTVVLFGGHVEEFVILPAWTSNGIRFGYVMYSGLGDAGRLVTTTAPFILAHVHALGGSMLIPRLRGPQGKVLFFTSVLLPMVDISMLHWGLFLRSPVADLRRFMDHPLPFLFLGLPALAGIALLAWRAFRSQWQAPHTLPRDRFLALLGLLLALPGLRFLASLYH